MTEPHTVAYGFLNFDEGGAQRIALTTWRHLDRSRFRPVLLCAGRRGALVDQAVRNGVPAQVLLRLQRPFDWGAIPRLARSLGALHAHIVHVPLYSRASPYVRAAAELARVPLVVAHEFGRAEPPSMARLVVDRLLAPRSHFVAVSRAHRDELLHQGVPFGRVKVLYDGVEIDAPRLSRQVARTELAAELGLDLDPSRPLVLVPARLHPMKGHVDLLAAIAALQGELPDLLVLCAGGGPLADQLPALASAAGLGRNVKFLGHRHDVAKLLAASDVVALTSHREGLPLALLEAMAAGRPVLATAVGGVPEAVEDGEVGRLVPARRPAAVAAALRQLVADPLLCARWGEAGRRHVAAHFTATASTRRLEAVYQEWLDEGVGARHAPQRAARASSIRYGARVGG